jgi:DNA replication and repair protein RecF
VQVQRLALLDFRCYAELDLELPNGATVITGANGQGKTSILEALDWIATGRSFRGVPDAALVRDGTERAIVRAALERDGRDRSVEAEIRVNGRDRILVNGKPVARRRDLVESLRVTVFTPDDLELVKGGPAGRRAFLDDLLVASAPRYDAARTEYERVLKQRNALLRGGMRGPDDVTTLDVFDAQLARAGAELARGRARLIARLEPELERAYAALASEEPPLATRYEAEWAPDGFGTETVTDAEGLLLEALSASRRREIDRGVTIVGPHRDEWKLVLHDLDARTHASQGEQRTFALALRLAAHRVVAELVEDEPVLLLDDVFSELDARRATALVANLPDAQTLVTTASILPEGIRPARRLRVAAGAVQDVT